MPSHHRTAASAVLTAAAVVGALVLGSAPAGAAPVSPTATPTATTVPAPPPAVARISGDLTGDGIRDVTVLGSTGTGRRAVCTATVRPGLPDGGTGSGTVVDLPVTGEPGVGGVQVCPDLGVVLAGRTPAQNLLAVTFSTTARRFAPSIQVFALAATGARFVNALDGQVPTTGLASVDFDGNGVGDLWQSGDQGFSSWTRRGSGWVSLYRSGPATGVQVQFLDLDRRAGRDIVVGTTGDPTGSGAPASVVAVDGLSGAVATLADGAPVAGVDVASYRVGFGDADGDGFLDVFVTPVLADGTVAPRQVSINRSQAGRWSFVRL